MDEPITCGGPSIRGRCARCSRAKPPQQGGGFEVLRRLLTGMEYVLQIIVTDRLKSYGAAIKNSS